VAAIVSVLALLAALSGCGGSARGGPPGGTGAETVTVLGAGSLTEAFTRLAGELEAAEPALTVRLSFAASSTLATQIVGGAPADVFAAANPATMDEVVDAGRAAGKPAVFARNRLQIAVPPGNPAGVAGLADFARPELDIALCAEQVPCGAAARAAFAAAGVRPAPDTLEQDVKATLTKVVLGEVDAALVYRTDVRAAGDDVEGVDFAEADRAVNDYLVVALRDAADPDAAAAFVAALRSPAGRRILTEAGFDAP